MSISERPNEALEPDVAVSSIDTAESAREKAHRFTTRYHGSLHRVGKDENVWCGHPRDVNFGVHSTACVALGVVYETHRLIIKTFVLSRDRL